MKILMGTKNPGKIEGAKQAFEQYFKDVEIEGIGVNSDVSNQPINEEIFLGAKNRIKNLRKYAKENNIDVDFYIASEAGIIDFAGDWVDINTAIIENKDGFQTIGTSQGFQIPERYMPEIKETELGKLMDKLFDGENLGKGKGGISRLTHNTVTRIELTKNAFVMALIGHINGDLWK